MAREKKTDDEMPPAEKARPAISVPAEQGEFHHQAEGAEGPCVTARAAASCACGLYDLAWAELSPSPERV